jgi:dTDP-4-dehydrorhamnose reductase
MRVLVIGATGMLGYSLFKNLSESEKLDVFGTVRSLTGVESYFKGFDDKIFTGIEIETLEPLGKVMSEIQPEIVINCIGLIKQNNIAKRHTDTININSLLPHKLAALCDIYKSKLVHFSTDCVFDGTKGLYCELDRATALDLYGSSKRLGEVDYGKHLTLRTSIIGHELKSDISLVDWFLMQETEINGYKKAVFSGLPTCSVASIICENLHKLLDISGLYHLSADPINKYDLLKLISYVYQKDIKINLDDKFVIDRSLDSSKLKEIINLKVDKWPELVSAMYSDYQQNYLRRENSDNSK